MQERRWDGAEWTDDTQEASVLVVAQPPDSDEPDAEDLPPARRATLALVVALVVLVAIALLGGSPTSGAR